MIDDPVELMGFLIICVAMALLGGFVGVAIESKSNATEAIRAGVAEYYLDAEHHRQFRWRTK